MKKKMLCTLTFGLVMAVSTSSAFADGITGTDPEPTQPPPKGNTVSTSSASLAPGLIQSVIIEQILSVFGLS